MDVELLRKLSQCSSPLMAASATFALNAGVWFRRGRLLIVAPDWQGQLARRQAETPLIVLCRFPGPDFTPCSGKSPEGMLSLIWGP